MRLVKFQTNTCVLCRRLDSLLTLLGVKYDIVDITNNTELQRKYNINSVPTLIKFDGDVEVERIIGLNNPEEIKNFVKDIKD